jgi:hypothetical protein
VEDGQATYTGIEDANGPGIHTRAS